MVQLLIKSNHALRLINQNSTKKFSTIFFQRISPTTTVINSIRFFNQTPATVKLTSSFESSLFSLKLQNSSRSPQVFVINNYSNAASTMQIATYDEVKDLPNHPEVLLVDVREPQELKDYGVIPTSINIPLATVEENLKLSANEFKNKFGRDKPETNTEVIFHCLKGGRAGKAADTATKLGFLNVKNYQGSWTDWAEKEGIPLPK